MGPPPPRSHAPGPGALSRSLEAPAVPRIDLLHVRLSSRWPPRSRSAPVFPEPFAQSLHAGRSDCRRLQIVGHAFQPGTEQLAFVIDDGGTAVPQELPRL